MGHHALVFGASGILGWSVVDQILGKYPEKGTFTQVTALCNRPLSEKATLWPSPGPDTPQIHIVDGIDLTKGTMEEYKTILKNRVPHVETVTHVYYFAYFFHPEFPIESEINLGMLRRGFGAVESLAPNLQYVILPTGTKGYGIHIPKRPFEAPFTEDMSDIPQPFHAELFYYVLHEELDRMQRGKLWKFAEVRCGPVLGFVPHKNPYNLSAIYMNFLCVYKYMHERNHSAASSKKVPFPASPHSYNTLFNDAGQDIFARFSIHLCLHPDEAGNSELYNIGDSSTPASMADRWPFICSMYGLVGVPPVEKSDPGFVLPVSFLADYADEVGNMEREWGVKLQEVGLDVGAQEWMEHFTFDHHQCMDKARKTGFLEELSIEESWKMVFDRYVEAKRTRYGS